MLTITSRENPQIKHLCALTSAAKKRRKEGQFVCEGFTLLEEALRRGLEPLAVYCLDSQAHRLPKLNCPCALVNQSVLEKISDVPAPQGVVFTLPLPEAGKTLSGSRFLALDSLRDPGNMGTILRTADALDVPVVLLEGSLLPAQIPQSKLRLIPCKTAAGGALLQAVKGESLSCGDWHCEQFYVALSQEKLQGCQLLLHADLMNT